MKIAIKTLGCKVNTYESEAIYEAFEKKNYQRVSPNEIADVYIINTCTVTNSGERKSRQTIRKMIRLNPEAVIVVMGCYAQLKSEDITKIEGVDIVVGTQGREKIYDLVQEFMITRHPVVAVSNIMQQKEFEKLEVINFASQTRAFIKIQEGCNNFCTFCIIPWARGLMRSQKPEIVLEQIRGLVKRGVKEVVLTGIHTAGYGDDLEDYNFASLLKEIDKISGIERIRISSIEISQITDELLMVLKESTKIVNHLHVPIQAGSDDILKKMKRHYNTKEFLIKLEQVRKIFPEIAFTTDIIVGFPGETKELFEQTKDTLITAGFSELHVFPYSVRAGTPAAKMDNQIPEPEKKRRVHELIALNNELALNYAQQFSNDIVTVLVEQRNKKGLLEGHTTNYLKVEFDGDDSLIHKIVNVELIQIGYPLNQGKLI